jgi:hypothetical protein
MSLTHLTERQMGDVHRYQIPADGVLMAHFRHLSVTGRWCSATGMIQPQRLGLSGCAIRREPYKSAVASPAERQQRRLAAILADNIAGYNALMGADEEATVRNLKGASFTSSSAWSHKGRVP